MLTATRRSLEKSAREEQPPKKKRKRTASSSDASKQQQSGLQKSRDDFVPLKCEHELFPRGALRDACKKEEAMGFLVFFGLAFLQQGTAFRSGEMALCLCTSSARREGFRRYSKFRTCPALLEPLHLGTFQLARSSASGNHDRDLHPDTRRQSIPCRGLDLRMCRFFWRPSTAQSTAK